MQSSDTLTPNGAARLANDIQSYWHSRGYDGVLVESYLIPGSENAWGTRSNLVAGMPRGVTARELRPRYARAAE